MKLTRLEIKALQSSLARIRAKIGTCLNADDIEPDYQLFQELIMKLEKESKV